MVVATQMVDRADGGGDAEDGLMRRFAGGREPANETGVYRVIYSDKTSKGTGTIETINFRQELPCKID